VCSTTPERMPHRIMEMFFTFYCPI
jgi:hypothetical protein